MSRVTLESNNSLVIIQKSPSFKTYNDTGFLFGGVTNSSFSVSLQREQLGAVGSKNFQIDNPNKHPDIDLSIEYLYNPRMVNEDSIGLGITTGLNYKPTGFLKQLGNKSNNFYFYNHPEDGLDAIEYFDSAQLYTPNSGEIISFGNSYLTSYGISFSNESIPTVTTTYKCSNLEGNLYTGDIKSPAINLQSGNAENVGNLVVSGTHLSGYGPGKEEFLDFTRPDLNAPACGMIFTLSNLQIGGQALYGADHRVQSMSMNIPINRIDLEGMGSDYVYDRKIKFPLKGSLQIESKVSKYEAGFISGMLANESSYSFSLISKNLESDYASIMRFKDLKLENFSYSMQVNEEMTYSSSFSFPINNVKEFNFWTTQFRDTIVFDSAGNQIRSLQTDIPAEWSAGDLTAARLQIGTAASTIGHDAFSGCSNITGTLTIPDFTEDIAHGAFKNCYGFTGDLYLHDSLLDVNRETFYNCSGFNGSLYLGESISGIGREAFYNCTGLNGDLVIPTNISSIGTEAFANCSGFKGSLTISNDTVTNVGNNAFSGCQFNELIVDEKIEQINDNDFDKFSDFDVLLTLPIYLSGIGDNAFDNYKITGSLLLPQFLKSVGNQSFYNNTGLNGLLLIDNEVEFIGNEAFYNCNNLTGNLLLPDSLTGLGYYAFADCEKLGPKLKVSKNFVEYNSGAFSGCFGITGGLTLTESILAVESAAFANCTGLNGSLKIIGPKNISIDSFENVNFKKLIIDKIQFISGGYFDAFENLSASLTLGEKTKTLGSGAFDGYSFTGSLDLNNVSLIGDSAFSGNSFDGNLILKSGVTGVGYGAFQDCSSFDGYLSIPNTIDKINDKVFDGCSNFTGDVIIGDNIKDIGFQSFNDCSGFRFFELQDSGVTGIQDSAFRNCVGLTGIDLNSGLERIGINSFQNCNNLTGTLNIPDSTVFIDEGAFSGCSGIQKIDLGCGLTGGLGFNVFTGCSGVRSIAAGTGVNLPLNGKEFTGMGFTNLTIKGCVDSVTPRLDYAWIRNWANAPTRNVSLTLESGIKNFPDTFNNSIIKFSGVIDIPDTVTGVGEYSFGYHYITGVKLGSGIEYIGYRAFYNNSAPRATGDLILPPNIKYINNDAFRNLKLYGDLILNEGLTGFGFTSFYQNYFDNITFSSTLKLVGNSSFLDPGVDKNDFIIPNVNSLETIDTNSLRLIQHYKFPSNELNLKKIRYIGANAFQDVGNDSLCSNGYGLSGKKLVFGDNVQYINGNAFLRAGLSGNLNIGQKSFYNVGNSAFENNLFTGYARCKPNRYPVPPDEYGMTSNSFNVAVGNYPFRRCNYISGLQIPYYVSGWNRREDLSRTSTLLEGYYRYLNNNLKSLGLRWEEPSEIQFIGRYAFSGDPFTGDLRIPYGLSGIDKGAFKDCSNFGPNLTLPNSNWVYQISGTAINSGAFENCTGFSKITSFPVTSPFEGVVDVDANGYTSGSGLLHPLAFSGCQFSALGISEGVTGIPRSGYLYYLNHAADSSLEIGDDVLYIDSFAFEDWPLTGGLNFGSNLERIDDYAFSGCSGLTGQLSLYGTTQIGKNVFLGADFSGINITGDLLTTSDLNINISRDDYDIFKNAVRFLDISQNCSGLGSGCFSGFANLTGDLSIPNSVTGIGAYAFSGCTTLTRDLIIESNVQEIGDRAFTGCNFSGFLTYGSNALVSDETFSSFYFDKLIIPNSATVLNSGSLDFYKNNGYDLLSTLEIREGISGISGAVFKDFGLNGALTFPDSLGFIGDEAFKNCSGFSGQLSFNDDLYYLGRESFLGCTGFEGELGLNDSIINIGQKAFYGLDNLTGDIVLPNNIVYIGESAFENTSGFGPRLVFNSSTELYIDRYAFRNCTGISNLANFDDSLTIIIGSGAFSGCNNITGDLVVPPSLTGIQELAFQGCSGIRNVYLDVHSNKIASNAFINGPTGFLYVRDTYSGTYGTTYSNMTVKEWV